MYNVRQLMLIMMMLYITGALVSLVFIKKYKLSNVLSNILSSTASALGIWASINYFFQGNMKISLFDVSFSVPYVSLSMTLDKLSAFFILTLSILALCVSIYSIGYISHYYGKRNVGLFNFLYNTFILSMISVITSRNIIFFLISWEVMSLVSYFLVIFEGEHRDNQKAGIIYLIMTHLATAFITAAFAISFKFTGSLEVGASLASVPPMVKNILFVCFLLGFGTKAGIIPLHVWLPYAHPAAPSNVSALMSGIMIKTAIYGLIRFVLMSLGAEFPWWGIAILTLGAISTVLGVAYALMEHNIKKLLAYHSIENIGIILIGIGISFYAVSTGNMVLASLAMLAGLFHLLNHTIFKGALFLGAGAMHYSTHTKDIEKLGGLLKRMPYTGLFFLIASLSISAIPPFNGFVSEWITYQALVINLGTSPSGIKIILMLSVAALAMAGALAATCFVKAFGISFLALPRSEEAKNAKEVPVSMLIGMGGLIVLCITFGLFPFYVINIIDKVNVGMFNHSIIQSLKGTSSFVYYPLVIRGNSISPFVMAIAGALLAILAFVFVRIEGQGTKERKYGTWDCGFTGLNSRMQYSATGFSKPIRIVFSSLYRPTRELKTEKGSSPYFHKSMKYVVTTQPIFEKYLYRPIIDTYTRFARRARLQVQTGSVHMYLIYIFITILVLLTYYATY